ncbi:dnaJ homolog subfamily C member 4 isoform X2 [Brachyhypopomus gauderio]|uniref:dnaJ homolog subfamily C member 4 isoform X2 n=1 Tax=Brachyhypopomus gauderio TaxID=698409 RepID=UPI004041E200
MLARCNIGILFLFVNIIYFFPLPRFGTPEEASNLQFIVCHQYQWHNSGGSLGSSIMQLEANLRVCQSCVCSLRLLSLSAAHRSSTSHYDVLGVKSDASLEEIKDAFFDKCKKMHPDRNLSNPSLHAQFVKLNEAYRVLSKEGTRREYDLRLRHPYSRNPIFRPSSTYTHHPNAGTAERIRYWEQFRYPRDFSEEQWARSRKKNLRLVGYCITAMLLSCVAHYFAFRKLEDVHKNFMDEKDRVITEIYNESKERARVNGFKKQQEILRQKHTEFLERYKIRQSGSEK